MLKASMQKKQYRAKHNYAPEEYNGLYTRWEDQIILTQRHPDTGEHLSLAQIAKALARSYVSVETHKRQIKKARNGFYKLELLDPKPEDHFAKEEKRYQDFIHGVDKYERI